MSLFFSENWSGTFIKTFNIVLALNEQPIVQSYLSFPSFTVKPSQKAVRSDSTIVLSCKHSNMIKHNTAWYIKH